MKKCVPVIFLVSILICLFSCDLWYQDWKGYMEHWSGSVQVSDVSVQVSPEIQKNSSGVDTIASYATVKALVNIINPENYSLDGGVGSAEENLRSVRIAGSAGSSVLPLANVTSMSSTAMEIQIAPLAQVLTEESLALEHTNFTVTFVPTRTENGFDAAEPRTITLRYNTPPRNPLELVLDATQQKLTWLNSNPWEIIQGTSTPLDNYIFWAWPSVITDPTHPDYVEKFGVYVDDTLVNTYAVADCLMKNVPALQQSYTSYAETIEKAGYDIYCYQGASGQKISVCAIDSEDVRSQMLASGIAPHKVILEANGGFFPSSGLPSVETYKAAGSIITGSDLEVPFRDGYFLTGWTSNGSAVSFPLSIDQPMTLVAQWTPYPADGETGGNTGSGSGSASDATYSITYDANGADSGTVPASQTKLAGKMVSLAKNNGSLTKQDHSFSGWNTAADGTGTSYAEGASYTLDASITLYAQWTRWNQVEPVQFDVGAGNVNFNTQVTLSTATPNATIHYTVNGSGEQIGSAGQSVVITITSDATISAYGTCDGMIQSTETSITYKLNTYTVSYDGNGSDGGAVPGVQSFTSGSSATVTGAGTMTRTGYTFTGWNTAANGSGTPYTEGARYSSDANLTLYAQWQPNTYTVTFDGNNHTSGSTTSQTFTYGVPQNLNANGFQRTDCTFAGWNTAANGSGTSYAEGASYTLDASITLYAQWTRWNQVEPVQFDVGAGNVNFNTQVTLSTATPNATIHYTVNGSGEQIGSAGQSVVITITSDATISAYGTCDGMIQSTETSITYKLNTYTVSYDGNGSDGGAVPGVQSFTSGSSATVTGAGTMTRTGYTFTGWNTAADGTGTSYAGGTSYTATGDITLYAQWEVDIISKLTGGQKTVALESRAYSTAELRDIANAIKNDSTSTQVTLDCSSITVENNEFPNLFQYNKNIVGIIFPATITTIGGWGFQESGLNGIIDIPASVTTIAASAFSTTNITEVRFASGSKLESIGNNAFNTCKNLTSIDLPATVTTIGSWAFYGCSGITIATVRYTGTMSLGQQIFEGSGLIEVNYYPQNIGDRMFNAVTTLKNLYVNSATPPTIESNAFAGITKSAVTVTVPAGSKSAFSSASGWSGFSNIVER